MSNVRQLARAVKQLNCTVQELEKQCRRLLALGGDASAPVLELCRIRDSLAPHIAEDPLMAGAHAKCVHALNKIHGTCVQNITRFRARYGDEALRKVISLLHEAAGQKKETPNETDDKELR